MQTVTELLSEPKRKVMYVAYAIIGVGLGATQTGFSAAEVGSPLWLVVASAVYLYVGGAFGLIAAQNVGAREVVVPDTDVDAIDWYQEPTEELVVEDLVFDTDPEIYDHGVDSNN